MLRLADNIGARVELDPPRAVDEVEERRPPVAAAGRDPPREPVAGVGLLAGPQAIVRGADRRDLGPAGVRVRERLDARLAQALELRPSLCEEAERVLFVGVQGKRLSPTIMVQTFLRYARAAPASPSGSA